MAKSVMADSYTHNRAHETKANFEFRLLVEKKPVSYSQPTS